MLTIFQRRSGIHRYGDDACQNDLSHVGNGHPQWLEGFAFLAAERAQGVRG